MNEAIQSFASMILREGGERSQILGIRFNEKAYHKLIFELDKMRFFDKKSDPISAQNILLQTIGGPILISNDGYEND